jgi:hypothetical protein
LKDFNGFRTTTQSVADKGENEKNGTNRKRVEIFHSKEPKESRKRVKREWKVSTGNFLVERVAKREQESKLSSRKIRKSRKPAETFEQKE